MKKDSQMRVFFLYVFERFTYSIGSDSVASK
jgi:hypothetical protein